MFQSDPASPAIEDVHVSQRILPGHCRRFGVALSDLLGDVIGFYGVN